MVIALKKIDCMEVSKKKSPSFSSFPSRKMQGIYEYEINELKDCNVKIGILSYS